MARSGLSGVPRLRRILRQMPDNIVEPVRKAVQEGAQTIRDDAKARAPVDSGALRAAIAVKPSASRDRLTARVGIFGARVLRKVYYARFVEFGVRAQVKGDRLLRADRRRAGKGKAAKNQTILPGKTLKRSRRTTKGQPPRPFLFPAFEANKKRVVDAIRFEVKAALERFAKRG